MSNTLANSFMFKVVATLVVVSTLITMSGVASIIPASAQVVADGALVKTADNDDVYIVKIIGSKTFKRLILNPAIFESYGHLSWSNIVTVSQATLDSYTTSNMVIEVTAAGAAVSGKVYIVSSSAGSDTGTKQWLNVTAADFEAAGLDWDSLYQVNATEAGAGFYPEGSAITDASTVDGATSSDDDGITTPGAEGSLTLTLRAIPSAVDLDEGGDVDEVAGFKLEADNSDVRVERVDVQLEAADAISEKPWTYFTRARLLVDGSVVATRTISSASDFVVTENGGDSDVATTDEFALRIIDLDFIVPADDSVIIEVELESVEDIDSANMTQTWTVGVPTNGIRGVDGAGLNVYTSTARVERTFEVSANATATLTPALSDNTPNDSYAEVDTSNATTDIEVLRFTLEADEGDVTTDDIVATVLTSVADESTIISAAHLYVGSVSEANRLGSEDVPNAGAVTFDNTNYLIEDGEKPEFIITVDVTSLAGTLTAGDSVTSIIVDGSAITATDELDNAVSGANVDPTSETIYFYEVFPTFALVSTSFDFITETSTPNSRANLEIQMDVTAVNGDIFISDLASDMGATDGVEVTITGDEGAATASVDTSSSNAGALFTSDFKIPSGTTKNLTVAINIVGNGAFASAAISSVFWGVAAGTTAIEKDFDWADFTTTTTYMANANT